MSVVPTTATSTSGGVLVFARKGAKALLAALIAALGSLATVLVGDMGLGDLTTGQWVTLAFAALVALVRRLRDPQQHRALTTQGPAVSPAPPAALASVGEPG